MMIGEGSLWVVHGVDIAPMTYDGGIPPFHRTDSSRTPVFPFPCKLHRCVITFCEEQDLLQTDKVMVSTRL